jgi:AraC-like DNA-binding protein
MAPECQAPIGFLMIIHHVPVICDRTQIEGKIASSSAMSKMRISDIPMRPPHFPLRECNDTITTNRDTIPFQKTVRILDKFGPIYHCPPVGPVPPVSVQFFGINYCNPAYRNIRRFSQITVFGYVMAGEGTIQVDDKTYSARQGDAFIMRSGCYHEVNADAMNEEPWTYIWYNITGGWTLKLLEAYQLLGTVVVHDALLEDLFRQGIDVREQMTLEELEGELALLIMKLVIRLSDIQRKREELLSLPVQQIKQQLDNHILQPFQTEQFAADIGMSSKQLNRVFKKELGTTVYNYLLLKKIESAKMMLINTNLTIHEIADRLGYSDAHYFSNLFQTKSGMRPSVYRTRYGQQDE